MRNLGTAFRQSLHLFHRKHPYGPVTLGAEMLSPRFFGLEDHARLDEERMASMADEGGSSAAALDEMWIFDRTQDVMPEKVLRNLLKNRLHFISQKPFLAMSAVAVSLGLGFYWMTRRTAQD